jgi:hypothetical protein
MRFCLFESGSTDGNVAAKPRLGLLRHDDTLVDVHAACVTSMADLMAPKRAREIGRALCPSDLLAFLENGRHAWNALDDSLRRLDGRLDEDGLTSPYGDAVIRRVDGVRVVPVVPWPLRYTGGDTGRWRALTVAGTGSTLHSDGRPYLPEYLAVIGTPGEQLSVDEAWDCVALVSETRPSDPIDAAVLRTPDELTSDDVVLRAAVAEAVAEASAHRRLLVGDVVRTGLELVAHLVDIDLTEAETPVGDALPAH